jgi:hypothetical protein
MSLYRYLGIDVNEVRLAHLGKPLIELGWLEKAG